MRSAARTCAAWIESGPATLNLSMLSASPVTKSPLVWIESPPVRSSSVAVSGIVPGLWLVESDTPPAPVTMASALVKTTRSACTSRPFSARPVPMLPSKSAVAT